MIQIRPLTLNDSSHFAEALELLNRTQGRDLFGPDYLTKTVQERTARAYGGFHGDRLVAVGVAKILPPDGFEYYLRFDPNLPSVFQSKKIGSLSTLCVHEDLQGQGVGQRITRERLEWLKREGCQVVVGISWVSGLSHTSDRVFEKSGFRAVKKIERFFYDHSLKSPFVCPACGEPPCTCAGILYRLDL